MIDYPDIVKKVRLSTALIFVLDANGDVIGAGSGFVFIKKGMLVTCNHVVAGAHGCLINFFDPTQTLRGRVILNDAEHDLALIAFSDDSRAPLLMGKMENVIEGISVIFSSYRLNVKCLTTRPGVLFSITKNAAGLTTYLIDGAVCGGDSGCPLIDSSGGVIGVVNARRVVREDVLEKIRDTKTGLVPVDLIKIYHGLMGNLHLGVGYAIPASYIPGIAPTGLLSAARSSSQKGLT